VNAPAGGRVRDVSSALDGSSGTARHGAGAREQEVSMKRSMKRLAAAVSLLLAVCAGLCAEAPSFTYVMPGDATRDNDAVIAAVNARLARDAGLQLKTVFIPWDAWENKINLMLASGDEFDLFHVMQDWIPYATYFSKGGLSDITDALASYGPNITRAVAPEIWAAATVKGRTYVVPTFWVELASEGDFTIRGDLLKQNGLSVPKTPDQLLAAMEKVMANWKGKDKPYLPLLPSGNNADPIGMHSSALHRAYAAYPFTVKEKLFYVSQAGEVKSWVETGEFKKDAAWFRAAYVKKLLNPDVLTIKQEQFNNTLQSGNWFVSLGTVSGLAAMQKSWPQLKDSDIVCARFNPEKLNVRPWGIKNCNAVPSTSKHPEAGVKFLNWLYANQDNYDLFMYGVEGKEFKKAGAHTRQAFLDDTNRSLYEQADWMMGNLNFIRVDAATPSAVVKDLYVIDSKAVNSPAADFFFDATNVRAELANVMSQFAAAMVPVYVGVLDWNQSYPAALEKMKAAGLDRVVAEYTAQLAAFRAAK
jgi:putative aldouronate transport system substrate-binding protein